jgi:hypothetical protein
MNFKTELDHIVIACNTLDEGRTWCREVLGVDAIGGGKHANIGTHNTLLGLAASHYMEIIAVDPEGATPAFPRWFGLDTDDVRNAIRHEPRLIGWVARVVRDGAPDNAIDLLATIPTNAANVVRSAERGDFRWRFAFTRDGARPRGGVLPHIIQWDVAMHPCERLPDAGVSLSSLMLGDPMPDEIACALDAMQFTDAKAHVGQSSSAQLVATLNTPKGIVVLE